MQKSELELLKAGLIALECLCSHEVSDDEMDFLTTIVTRIKAHDAHIMAAATQQ
jgi:hypothetical protein